MWRNMMNYSIVNVDDMFAVKETATEQIIKTFKTKEKARKLMKHLNLGGGFDAWTPTFIVRKIK
jgi:hypothetical protein